MSDSSEEFLSFYGKMLLATVLEKLWPSWIFFIVFLKNIFLIGYTGSSFLCTGFSLVAASGRLLSSCSAWASHCGGFSGCRAQVLGAWPQQLWLASSRAQVQQLRHTSLVTLWHVGFSQTRNESTSPQWQADSQPPDHQEIPKLDFCNVPREHGIFTACLGVVRLTSSFRRNTPVHKE